MRLGDRITTAAHWMTASAMTAHRDDGALRRQRTSMMAHFDDSALRRQRTWMTAHVDDCAHNDGAPRHDVQLSGSRGQGG